MIMSGGWLDCLLGDVVTFKRGYDLPQQQRTAGGVPIVSSSGISGYHNEAKVEGPGVVTGRYGTLGEVFYIEQGFWPLNTSLYVQDFKGNHPRFIGYFLRTLNLGRHNVAGAVPGVNRNALHRLPVRIPPHAAQGRIASILSAYDDLIENNTRRIRILEEMARALYREWFVHFRFPGHEKVRMVSSRLAETPEGWGKTLGDVLTLKRGYDLPEKARQSGTVPIVSSSGITGYHNEAKAKAPGVVTGRYGTLGEVFYLREDFWPLNTTLYVRDFKGNDPCLVKHMLETLNLAHQNAAGAVPGVNRNALHLLPVAFPPVTVQRMIAPTFHAINDCQHNLRAKNENLHRTRDLLLPRLISGEVDVSDLDIDVPAPAAV
jgi:type I restriction enzyme S subunit